MPPVRVEVARSRGGEPSPPLCPERVGYGFSRVTLCKSRLPLIRDGWRLGSEGLAGSQPVRMSAAAPPPGCGCREKWPLGRRVIWPRAAQCITLSAATSRSCPYKFVINGRPPRHNRATTCSILDKLDRGLGVPV